MRVCVLGPVAIVSDGIEVHLGATRESALLSDLAAHRGEVVPVDRLIDDLWHGEPTPGSVATLQTYVRNLRRVLEPDRPPRAPSEVLVSRSAGYVLELGPDQLDARRFEDLAGQGRIALQEGDHDGASQLLRAGLDLWRGPAFAEWCQEPHLRSEAVRLEERRITAVEDLAEAELCTGGHVRLCGELESLVGAHPLRERLWGHLMLALYRSGRQADALGAYRRLRRLLAEELGIEPSEVLRRLEQRILLQDPSLAWNEVRPDPPAAPRWSTAADLGHGLASTTRFIGRNTDVRAVHELLRAGSRMVTLTGPGGVGKTRLALHVATTIPEVQDGVHLVELSGVRDPSTVADVVLTALGGRRGSGGSALLDLADHVQGRSFLLVLDNCEHLIDPAAECAEVLVRHSAGVVLATSRQALGLVGEQLYPVAPLGTEPAVELFCDRARAVDPAFSAGAHERLAIASIAARLDGLPLALELAAARTRSMTVHDIERHLQSRFRLLEGPLRGGINPHTSLRAAVQWSYDLLDAEERALLRDLSVFPHHFDVAAVVAVSGTGTMDRFTAIGLLDRLVTRSLLTVSRSRSATRYSLLETIRQFAIDVAAAEQRTTGLASCHAAHYLSVAWDAHRLQRTAEGALAAAIFSDEWDNFRAASDHLTATGDAGGSLGLIDALYRFVVGTFRFEVLEWGARALAIEGARSDPSWPVAAACVAFLRRSSGDLDGAERLGREAVEVETVQGLPRRFGPTATLWALSGHKDHEWAEALLPEVERIAWANGDVLEVSATTYYRVMSDLETGRGDPERLAREHLRRAHASGCPLHLAQAYMSIVAVEAPRDTAAAIAALEQVERWEAVAGARGLADNAALHIATRSIWSAPEQALRYARYALRTSFASGGGNNLDISLAAVLLPLLGHGRHRTVAVLLGGLDRNPLAIKERRTIVDQATRQLEEALGPALGPLRLEGAGLDIRHLARLALDEIDQILDDRPGEQVMRELQRLSGTSAAMPAAQDR